MTGLLDRFYNCRYMIKENQRAGEIPSSGDIYQRTLDVAWPSALESVLVSLVGMVDTMMVGSIGPEAIAAVGITNQPRLIFLAIIMSLNVGVTAVVARRKGAEDREGANSVLKQAVLLSSVIALAATLLAIAFARPINIFAGAGEDIIDDATAYFRIIMSGMFFNCLLLTINAAQRGVGKTKISMRTNLTANGVNIVFNYLLIGGNFGFPRLGVRGAAIATVIGLAVGCLMSLMSVLHPDGFLSLRLGGSWRLERKTMGPMWKVWSSALIEQMCMRFGFFLYVKIVATLGTIAFATHQICMNVFSISFSVGDGLSIASSSLVGQSLGAKRPDMAIIHGKACQRIAQTLSAVLTVIFILFRRYIMMAFTTDEAIILQGMDIMIVLALTCFIQNSQVVTMGSLRGAGDTRYTAMVSLISIAIIRPGTAWLFCYPLGLGIMGAWYSMFADQCIRAVLSVIRFSSGNWTKLKL